MSEASGKLKRRVKTYFVLILVILFCISLSFGLVHHFLRYSWAGDVCYYTALLFVATVIVEVFLITFTK